MIDKCLAETRQHIARVGHFLNKFIVDLIHRAEIHDASKLVEPELSGFAAHTGKLEKVGFGTPEYKELLDELKPTVDHHYSKNRHHPQHWKNGINDMTLLDLLEMLADWKAAGERNANGNIRKSIAINAEKYEMSPQLVKIFENTVREYFTE
jgi:hypothetical protein